jgi:hypothetical protein
LSTIGPICFINKTDRFHTLIAHRVPAEDGNTDTDGSVQKFVAIEGVTFSRDQISAWQYRRVREMALSLSYYYQLLNEKALAGGLPRFQRHAHRIVTAKEAYSCIQNVCNP